MRTWEDYKKHVKSIDEPNRKLIEEMEEQAAIISAIIEQRKNLGLSQRDLADMSGLPQSTVARIESCKTTPSLGTLLRIMHSLGLKLHVTSFL